MKYPADLTPRWALVAWKNQEPMTLGCVSLDDARLAAAEGRAFLVVVEFEPEPLPADDDGA